MAKLLIAICFLLSTACTAERLDKTSTPETAESFTLTKKFQRVQRLRCDGSILSDSIEVVSSPTKAVEIVPKHMGDLADSTFRNESNGSEANCKISLTRFQIDASPSFCNLEVSDGLNEIRYEFRYCPHWKMEWNNDGTSVRTCAAPLDVRETGRVFIRVNYAEERLNGTLVRECVDSAAETAI